jgi:glycosyltransferase involved in cell wall biosynthesis
MSGKGKWMAESAVRQEVSRKRREAPADQSPALSASRFPLRVLHVIPAVAKRYGGPSTAIFPMCRALIDAGCEVRLCTTNADGDLTLPVEMNRFIEYEGVQTIFFPHRAGEFKYSRPIAIWLNQHVKDFDVVHIHAVFNHSSIAAARACQKNSVRYIVRPLGTLDPWSMRQKSLKKKLFWNSFGKRMLAGAAAVHYTADAEKRAVEESLNVNHGVVVPLGVDIPAVNDSQFAIRNSQSSSSHDSSLSTHRLDRPYILFLSRLHKKKGLEVLIEAFASLITDPHFAEWRLVIAGDGEDEYVSSLKNHVISYQMDRFVEFVGWLDGAAKREALSRASLLALPSYQENFGMSAVEAMALGVPVLISPHVNLADEIRRASAGWIASVQVRELAGVLEEAIGSQAKRTEFGKNAFAFAANHTWQSVAVQLKAIYSAQ